MASAPTAPPRIFADRAALAPATVETRRSWLIAFSALGVLSVAFGAPTITVVAMAPIAAHFGGERTVPALCYSLVWLFAGAGGLAMGPIADRVGLRWTVIFGSVMIALGLLLSSRGGRLDLYLGHGLLMGLLGNGAINAPLYIYIARWFDRRRGSALALLASGQAVAGAIWAPLFGHALGWFGWRQTMQLYAAVTVAVILPVAFFLFGAAPGTAEAARGPSEPAVAVTVLGLRPRAALGLIAGAGFLCCVPMAMPQAHLVAFCGDVGIPLTRGSTMLSLLLACAFIGRQVWGFVADRVGGLRTIFYGSLCQAAATLGFVAIRSEAGLFAVAIAFGLGFSGIIPAYVLAVRELFPAREAAWRVPIVMLLSGAGMAAGGWLGGAIYDYAGFYGAAFAAGFAFNLANLLIVGPLVGRQRRSGTSYSLAS